MKNSHIDKEEQELKEYRFYAETTIEAHSEREAKEQFAHNSFHFAAKAKCVEIK